MRKGEPVQSRCALRASVSESRVGAPFDPSGAPLRPFLTLSRCITGLADGKFSRRGFPAFSINRNEKSRKLPHRPGAWRDDESIAIARKNTVRPLLPPGESCSFSPFLSFISIDRHGLIQPFRLVDKAVYRAPRYLRDRKINNRARIDAYLRVIAICPICAEATASRDG